jgi:hypothetical protein
MTERADSVTGAENHRKNRGFRRKGGRPAAARPSGDIGDLQNLPLMTAGLPAPKSSVFTESMAAPV